MLEPDTILNGRYRILEQVGEGGMATVYRAVDVRLGRTVAVKVLHPEYARDEPFLQRFQQEAEFAASLGAHPNIVDIYDIGEDGPYHYIIMAFVEGRSLKEMIQERAPFSVGEAFAIGAQVASALDFAHKRGLVHRDVKPQNILVTPEGVAKVTDFGIARSVSTSQLTRPGMVIGTVHYFSPEQAQGKVASPASDVYALGIILYEMLTGHLPFDAETPIGVAMQHVHSEPPSPWEYNPDLPARAVGTVMRALEKDPERRYRDAAEFASALSAQATPDLGATTTFSPIPVASAPRQAAPPQHTAVYGAAETVAREPVEYVVEEPARPPRASTLTPPDRKTMWTALGAVLLALGVALAAFFGTRYVLSSGNRPTATATVTPTATATPRPRRHRPTATPYVPVVIQPTSPPLIPPTPTPTPIPPPPTKPPPTPTPTPRPTPTPTPAPPTPTPTPLFPTQPPTPVG